MNLDRRQTEWGAVVTPNDPIIRLARPDEVALIMQLVRRCIHGMRQAGIDQWDDVYPDEPTIRVDVREEAAYVACDGDGIAGIVVLNEKPDPAYQGVSWQYLGRSVVVHRLMVCPMREGRGVGRALLAFAESRATELGFECIRLDAFLENPRALRLYEKVGYRRAGEVQLRKGLFACFEKELKGANKALQQNRDDVLRY